MKRVAIYYRVSTDKQELASQKSSVEAWFDGLSQANKPQSVQVFQDEGVSGKTTNRKGLQGLLKIAYEGKIDTIVVYRLDRFSRDASTAIRLILSLDTAGVAFVAVTQPVLNLGHENPFRRTMLAAFAEIAEIERETIVARVVAGLEAAKKRGVVLGAPRKINDQTRLDAKLLRQNGATMRQIARDLNLSLGSVSALLKQPGGQLPDLS